MEAAARVDETPEAVPPHRAGGAGMMTHAAIYLPPIAWRGSPAPSRSMERGP
jgi:hypothetical protein